MPLSMTSSTFNTSSTYAPSKSSRLVSNVISSNDADGWNDDSVGWDDANDADNLNGWNDDFENNVTTQSDSKFTNDGISTNGWDSWGGDDSDFQSHTQPANGHADYETSSKKMQSITSPLTSPLLPSSNASASPTLNSMLTSSLNIGTAAINREEEKRLKREHLAMLREQKKAALAAKKAGLNL